MVTQKEGKARFHELLSEFNEQEATKLQLIIEDYDKLLRISGDYGDVVYPEGPHNLLEMMQSCKPLITMYHVDDKLAKETKRVAMLAEGLRDATQSQEKLKDPKSLMLKRNRLKDYDMYNVEIEHLTKEVAQGQRNIEVLTKEVERLGAKTDVLINTFKEKQKQKQLNKSSQSGTPLVGFSIDDEENAMRHSIEVELYRADRSITAKETRFAGARKEYIRFLTKKIMASEMQTLMENLYNEERIVDKSLEIFELFDERDRKVFDQKTFTKRSEQHRLAMEAIRTN